MRFRPLRTSTTPETGLAPVPDPPATMRAAVIESTGEPGVLHEATVAVPSPVLSELLVGSSRPG